MAGALDDLYQQVILDHYRAKHGYGQRDAAGGAVAGSARRHNPLCGDDVTLTVVLDDDADVRDVAWVGDGCSISQASTSVLHDLVLGRPAAEATAVVEAFRTMVRSRGEVADEDVLGDAVAFAGVGRHVNRVKCAMLGWGAFEEALLLATDARELRRGPGQEEDR